MNKDIDIRKEFDREAIKKGLITTLSISVIIVVAIMLFTFGPKTFSSLSKIRFSYLLVSLLLLIISWYIESLRIISTIKAVTYKDVKFGINEGVELYLANAFLSGVTPFTSGGWPLQIYYFTRKGLSLGEATMIPAVRSLVKTVIFGALSPFLFIIFKRELNTYYKFPDFVIYIGLFLSILLVIGFLLMARYPYFTRKILMRLLINQSIRRKKLLRKSIILIVKELVNFQTSGRVLLKRWGYSLWIVILTILFWAIQFVIPILILKGLSGSAPIKEMIIAQVILNFVVPFSPTPGGSGAAELGFAGIFSPFVPKYLLGAFTTLWRFATFYVTLIVGGIYFYKILRRF